MNVSVPAGNTSETLFSQALYSASTMQLTVLLFI